VKRETPMTDAPFDIHWVDGAGQEISLDAALKGAKSAFPATRKPR